MVRRVCYTDDVRAKVLMSTKSSSDLGTGVSPVLLVPSLGSCVPGLQTYSRMRFGLARATWFLAIPRNAQFNSGEMSSSTDSSAL